MPNSRLMRLLATAAATALIAGYTASNSAIAQSVTLNGVAQPGSPNVTSTINVSGTNLLAITTGASIQTTTTIAVGWNAASTTASITNAGTILSTTARAINSSGPAAGRTLTITNQAGGIIQSNGNDALRVNTNITSGTVTIINAGIIQATPGAAVFGAGQAVDLNGMNNAGATLIVTNQVGGIIRAQGDDALRPGLNATVNNYGTISSTGPNTSGGANGTSDAIDVRRNGVTITNFSGGLISGARHGITNDACTGGENPPCITPLVSTTVVNNAGATIIGNNGSGVGFDGTGSVTNYGTITGAYAGPGNIFNSSGVASVNGDGDGVDIDNLATINNYGTIQGMGAGGVDSGGNPNGADGIAAGGGTINNFAGAVIAGRGSTGKGILIDNGSEGAGVGTTTIVNAGSIIGEGRYGIRFIGTFADSIANSGIISGANGDAILMGAGNDTLTITGGSISGAIDGDDITLTAITNGTGDILRFNTGSGTTYTLTNTVRNFEILQVQSGTLINNTALSGLTNVTISNNAGFAPTGSKSGTLSIAGNYSQGTGSTLIVAVDAGGASRIAATGTATLAGSVQVQTGTAGLGGNPTYAIVTATGGVSGTYSGVTTNSAFLTPSLSYNATNAFVTLTKTATIQSVAKSANQSSIGRALDILNTSPTAGSGGVHSAVLSSVLGLNASQASEALTQLGGGATNQGAAQSVGLSAGRALTGTFMKPVALGIPNGTFSADAPSLQRAQYASADSDQVALLHLDLFKPAESRWGSWINGFGTFGAIGADANGGEIGFSSAGAAFGADYRFDNGLTAGLAFAYASSNSDQKVVGASTKSDSFSPALYAGYRQGQAYVTGTIGYAYSETKSDRTFVTPVAGLISGRTTGNQFISEVETGYQFDAGPVIDGQKLFLTPFAGFQTSVLTTNGYTETGSTGAELTIRETTSGQARLILGGQIDTNLAGIDIRARTGWVRDALNEDRLVTAAFAGAASSSFTAAGTKPQQDAALIGLGLTTALGPQSNVYLRYDGEVGSKDRAHGLTGGVRLSW